MRSHWLQVTKLQNKILIEYNNEQMLKYGYPVDFQKCQNHRKANLICKIVSKGLSSHSNEYQRQICQCCGRTIGNEPIKTICIDNKIFTNYGPGIPLYFLFFKNIIFLVLMMFFTFGLFSLMSNYFSTDCHKFRRCWDNSFPMKISFLNSYESEHVSGIQLTLIFLLIILMILIFLKIENQLKRLKQAFDDALTSSSDFSMVFKRLPQNTTEEDIKKAIYERLSCLSVNQKINTNNLKINKILFAYDLEQYLEVEKQNLKNFKKSCQYQTPFYKIPLPKITTKLSTALVIFQKQQSKEMFTKTISMLQQLKKGFWLWYQPLSQKIKVKNEFIHVERAPEPDDIIWQNFAVSITELFVRRVIVLSLSIFLLIISAFLQYILARYRLHYTYNDQRAQKIFGIASALLITLINFVIQNVLVLSAQYQKPSSHTLLKVSMTFKLVLMQFINSGLISILISAFMYYPQFRFYKSVVCNDMVFIMLANAVVNNIVNFALVYFQIPNWYERWRLQRVYSRQNFKSEIYTQLQANKIYEANHVDFQYKCAYIFKTLWLTAFFAPAQPIVLVLSFLALLINYWSQKYLFSGCYTTPKMLSGKISIAVLSLLYYTCFWLVLGSFFIHSMRVNFHFSYMQRQYFVAHIVYFIISLFPIFAPLSAISSTIFGKPLTQIDSYKSYELEQKYFQITYEMTNPAYGSYSGYHLGNGNRFLKLRKRKYKSKPIINYYTSNINNNEENEVKGDEISPKILNFI